MAKQARSSRPAPRDRAITRALSKWFRTAARDLPWREEFRAGRDPYRSLVSEFMLQQTQVSRVLEKFEPFLQRFPTVGALADAPEQDVLAAWSGLGYYRRARLLHACAKSIVSDFGGEVPRDVESLQELPGIGRYTAGAIASIVFDQPEPIVDGNVCRVLQRLDAKPGSASDKEVIAWAWERAESLVKQCPNSPSQREGAWGGRRDARKAGAASKVPSAATLKSRRQTNPPPNPSHLAARSEGAFRHGATEADDPTPATFNEGLMELGALVCTPAAPKCLVCPLRDLCLAREQGLVDEIPAPKARAKRSRVYHDTVVVWRKTARGVEVLLEQRPATGLWAGLWQPPTVESHQTFGRTATALLNNLRIDRISLGRTRPRRLVFNATHREIRFRIWVSEASAGVSVSATRRWVCLKDLGAIGISNAHAQLLRLVPEGSSAIVESSK